MKNKIQRTPYSSTGMVMAVVLVILFVLSVLGFAFGSRGTMALSQAYTSRQYMLAFYAAQAGIMTAIVAEQQSDPNIPTACGAKVSSDAILPAGATLLASLQGLAFPYALPNNASVSLTITNNTAIPVQCGGPANAPDGTVVPIGSVYITARGTAQGRTKISNVMIPVTDGTLGVDFNYGMFAKKNINMSTGSSTDSYNSALGAYNVGGNKGNKGNIGSDSNANGTVSLTTGATVKGEVDVGPGGTGGSPTIVANTGATYSKGVVLSTQVTYPVVPDPLGGAGASNFSCAVGNSCTLTPGQYNNLNISTGATVTVGCGNYSMNSINVSTGATLTINCSGAGQAAKFYVEGGGTSTPINFSTGTISNLQGGVQVPGAFQIYDLKTCGSPSCGTDTLSTGSGSAFALYAPNDTINISTGGNIYGALVGYTINDSTGANLHYDQALSNVPIGQASTPAVVGNFTVWNFQ